MKDSTIPLPLPHPEVYHFLQPHPATSSQPRKIFAQVTEAIAEAENCWASQGDPVMVVGQVVGPIGGALCGGSWWLDDNG